MSGFEYKNGALFAENVNLADIAKQVGTPFYCYSQSEIEDRFKELQSVFANLNPLIAYAMKANSNQAILSLLAKQGAGADIVSMGELKRALKAGFSPDKIVFAGVGKNKEELRFALENNIHCFNLESLPELERLDDIAKDMGKIASVSVRINPDVDAKTHAKISTGKSENKFGIPYVQAIEIFEKIKNSNNLKAIGLDMHIGSQIIDLSPFDAAIKLLADLFKKLNANGHDLQHIDIGGGLGISHGFNEAAPDLQKYAQIVNLHVAPLNCGLIIEPGRWMVGNAGVLVAKVEYIKKGANKNFVIVNAAMNDLLRPTLYEAEHDILPLKKADNDSEMKGDVVGPICESGDYLAQNRTLATFKEDDLIAIMSTGAYGAVMASTYNSRPLISEVLVRNDKFATIRERQTIENLISKDKIPNWL
jgi:diaminopimelate decarboxylase